MRWPVGIKTSTRTAEEHEARIKTLQTQRLHAEELARWHHGDLEWRKQALEDSYRQQAREGWIVMKTFQPFPVKTLKLSGVSRQLILPGPEPVWPYGESVPPMNPTFRTLTLQRGEGYINEAGELVVVL